MALETSDIALLEELLLATEGGPDLVPQLRASLPGMVVTSCDEEDVDDAVPFRSHPLVRVHLVDGSNHCWSLTTEPSRATGLLLARRRRKN